MTETQNGDSLWKKHCVEIHFCRFIEKKLAEDKLSEMRPGEVKITFITRILRLILSCDIHTALTL
ncbi:hypothetical protein HXA35_14495 [Bacillus sp. A301a_S52]|nr:hypothetical protein [Bacillus sp. A301a_S52]